MKSTKIPDITTLRPTALSKVVVDVRLFYSKIRVLVEQILLCESNLTLSSSRLGVLLYLPAPLPTLLRVIHIR